MVERTKLEVEKQEISPLMQFEQDPVQTLDAMMLSDSKYTAGIISD